ncbi:mechanosensitive ion channel family protein [Paenibacillus protaetiae]|uniref:Mechanosensitive ion channel family protein n=2 Tax=Paenibacillus protaetiae TaxID=2509456 RepID=A0A4P6F5P9_9BACL|nr:mechanosensitive ion channel family protein [Paenibacillus protaetiae]
MTDSDTWTRIGESAFRIVVIIAIGLLMMWVVHKTIDRIILQKEMLRLQNHSRRMNTVGKLLKNIVTYVVYFIGGLLILSEFGIHLAPLLAGAGVIGLAIGFGAQSLVKDVITGFFIILEDQFAVGDVIQTGSYRGTVEVIGLRATRILSWTGEVYIIPNGMINEVTNFSLRNAVAVIDIAIAYESDVERATEVISGHLAQFQDENLVKTPEVLGVQSIGASEVTLRVTAECLPNTTAAISRKLNGELKKALDENGIEFPYTRMMTYQRNEKGGAKNGA